MPRPNGQRHKWWTTRDGFDNFPGADRVDIYPCERSGCPCELGIVRRADGVDVRRYRRNGGPWMRTVTPCEGKP